MEIKIIGELFLFMNFNLNLKCTIALPLSIMPAGRILP
jgi:hypothetical protein